MNETTNYIFRHLSIAENNLRYLKKRSDATSKCICGLGVSILFMHAAMRIQQNMIKNLQKEVDELKKSEGEK